MEKDWMLMNVSITDGMYVNAYVPNFFDTEDDAIDATLQNLAEDFGITKEEVEMEADIEGTPTTVYMELSLSSGVKNCAHRRKQHEYG